MKISMTGCNFLAAGNLKGEIALSLSRSRRHRAPPMSDLNSTFKPLEQPRVVRLYSQVVDRQTV
jgi:hypothetical protein